MTRSELRPAMSRRLGVGIVVLGVGVAGWSAWSEYVNGQRAECQAEVNARFLQVQIDRAALADGDRESLARLVDAVVNARTGADSRAALRRYLDEKRERDTARDELPLPDPDDLRC